MEQVGRTQTAEVVHSLNETGQLGHMSCEIRHYGASCTFRSVLSLVWFVLVCNCSRSAQLWSVYITCSSPPFSYFSCVVCSVLQSTMFDGLLFFYSHLNKYLITFLHTLLTATSLIIAQCRACSAADVLCSNSVFKACLLYSHVVLWVRIHDDWQVMATIAVFEVMEIKVRVPYCEWIFPSIVPLVPVYHWVGAATSYFLSSQTWWLRHLCHCTVTPERTSDFSEPAQSQWCQGEPMSCSHFPTWLWLLIFSSVQPTYVKMD